MTHTETHIIDTGSAVPERKRVSWGAIFAGTIIGLGVMVLLGLLGAGIGLSVVEPGGETDTIGGMSMGAAIYLVISQLIALAIGGYAAARMSATWDGQNAMLHGATVWGLVTLAMIYLATAGAGAIYNNTVSAVSSAASAAQTAATAVIPDNLPSYNLPEVQMSDLPPPVRNALKRQGVTAENFRAETREAFRKVISQEEQKRARTIATNTARDVILSPSDAMSDIDAAIDNLVGQGGVISAEDRQELATVMENRLGITPQEAEAMIAKYEERAKQAAENAQQALVEARNQALETAQAATDAVATASFWAFFASLLGLGAAAGGARAGRREHPVES